VALVATVLALLLVGAAPRFAETAQRLRVEQTVFEFAQLLRYAHARAVAQGDVIVMRWHGEHRRARLHVIVGQDPRAWPSDCAPDAAPLPAAPESPAVPAGVAVTWLHKDRAVDCVNFFPDGTSEPTSLHFVERGRDYTIAVDGSTSQAVVSTRAAAR